MIVDEPDVDGWFEQLARHGLNVDAIDRRPRCATSCVSAFAAGEVVLAPGTAASVVLIPLGPGTRVEPIGGYPI